MIDLIKATRVLSKTAADKLPMRKIAPHDTNVRVLCDVQFRLKYRLMFGTFILRKGVDLLRKKS